MKEEKGPLIVTANIPRLLAEEPLDSLAFRFACEQLISCVSSPEPIDEKIGEIKECFRALRGRVAEGMSLDDLARKIGKCLVIGVFASEIRADKGQTTEGLLGCVNEYVRNHLESCSACSLALRGRLSSSDAQELETACGLLAECLGRLVHV